MSGDSRPQNTPVIAIAEPGDSQVNGLFPLEQTVTSLSITQKKCPISKADDQRNDLLYLVLFSVNLVPSYVNVKR